MPEHFVKMTAMIGQLPSIDKEKVKELKQLPENIPMEQIQRLINDWEKEEFSEFRESEARAESRAVGHLISKGHFKTTY